MADPCPPSAESASVIDSCPMILSEWNQRALQKNCSRYPQTCFRPLEYHCLLNPYGNESLEVCAPNTWMAEGKFVYMKFIIFFVIWVNVMIKLPEKYNIQ